MDRVQAYKTLLLDEAADGQMVQAAYWTLVRQAQDRGRHDTAARRLIDGYNEAYATLAPGARLYEPPEPRQTNAAPQGTEFLDRAVDWLSAEALRTRARWRDRNPEIGVILGVTLFLMILAIGAGASFWLVLLSVLAIVGAIWAPWRRLPVGGGVLDEREATARRRPPTEA